MAGQFQADPNVIRWRVSLRSPIDKVYNTLATDEGRASFWAESAVASNGVIHFVFPNGATWDGEILEQTPPSRFVVRYYGGSISAFDLEEDGQGGTLLVLTDTGVAEEDRVEVIAGWVSVLMALKAAVDFGIDLRAHHPGRQWDNGFVEN